MKTSLLNAGDRYSPTQTLFASANEARPSLAVRTHAPLTSVLQIFQLLNEALFHKGTSGA